MKTIEELEKFLEEESYSFVELSIGNHFAPQGIVIKQEGNRIFVFGKDVKILSDFRKKYFRP